MLNSLFRGRHKYATLKPRDSEAQKEVPGGLWTKCEECGQIIYNKELKKNLMVCPRCGYYFRASAWERISQLIDEGTFQQLEDNVVFHNPLGFPGYEERIERARRDSGLESAVISGVGLLDSHPVVICPWTSHSSEPQWIDGGEKIALAIEAAIESDSL